MFIYNIKRQNDAGNHCGPDLGVLLDDAAGEAGAVLEVARQVHHLVGQLVLHLVVVTQHSVDVLLHVTRRRRSATCPSLPHLAIACVQGRMVTN